MKQLSCCAACASTDACSYAVFEAARHAGLTVYQIRAYVNAGRVHERKTSRILKYPYDPPTGNARWAAAPAMAAMTDFTRECPIAVSPGRQAVPLIVNSEKTT